MLTFYCVFFVIINIQNTFGFYRELQKYEMILSLFKNVNKN